MTPVAVARRYLPARPALLSNLIGNSAAKKNQGFRSHQRPKAEVIIHLPEAARSARVFGIPSLLGNLLSRPGKPGDLSSRVAKRITGHSFSSQLMAPALRHGQRHRWRGQPCRTSHELGIASAGYGNSDRPAGFAWSIGAPVNRPCLNLRGCEDDYRDGILVQGGQAKRRQEWPATSCIRMLGKTKYAREVIPGAIFQ